MHKPFISSSERERVLFERFAHHSKTSKPCSWFDFLRTDALFFFVFFVLQALSTLLYLHSYLIESLIHILGTTPTRVQLEVYCRSLAQQPHYAPKSVQYPWIFSITTHFMKFKHQEICSEMKTMTLLVGFVSIDSLCFLYPFFPSVEDKRPNSDSTSVCGTQTSVHVSSRCN